MLASQAFSAKCLVSKARNIKACAEAPKSDPPKTSTPTPAATESSGGMPEPVQKVADFFMKEDFTLQKWDFYNNKLSDVVQSDLYQKATGWKELPEIINGRVAMISFIAGALAEVFGAGTMYKQLAAGPAIVILLQVVLTAASIIPVYRGVDDKQIKELFDQATLPGEVFSPKLEKFHGRVAMSAFVIFLLVEAFKGSPIL